MPPTGNGGSLCATVHRSPKAPRGSDVGRRRGLQASCEMRLLVTGAGGQLGHDVVAAARGAGDDVLAVARADLDITDRAAVLTAIIDWAPDVVVNCAAWTAVDACESDHERAFAANGMAVRWIAEACDRTGAHLVHISTDYVFDGTLDRPYH